MHTQLHQPVQTASRSCLDSGWRFLTLMTDIEIERTLMMSLRQFPQQIGRPAPYYSSTQPFDHAAPHTLPKLSLPGNQASI